MNWTKLTSLEALELLKQESKERKVLIFKHSTRCSISNMALARLERSWKTDAIKPYLLEVLNYRAISDQIARDFGVIHESPQVLLIVQNKCVYHESHGSIDYNELKTV